MSQIYLEFASILQNQSWNFRVFTVCVYLITSYTLNIWLKKADFYASIINVEYILTGQAVLHIYNIICTVKPVLSCHSKRIPKMIFKTHYPLMQVKNFAESSKGSILQFFRPSLATICHQDLCFVYF